MCVSYTRDRSIVPLQNFIQQAHQVGVGDKRADLRFVDMHELKYFVEAKKHVIPSEVEKSPALVFVRPWDPHRVLRSSRDSS
jgi:hypothetical protein